MNQFLPALGLLAAILLAAIVYKRAFDARCRRENRAMRAALLEIVCAGPGGAGQRQLEKQVIAGLRRPGGGKRPAAGAGGPLASRG